MPTGCGTSDFTIAFPSLSVSPISWIAGRAAESDVITPYRRCRVAGSTPSVSVRCTRVATTVSAVFRVVSICCETDSARLAVTILVLRRFASRTCHICHVSIPTRAKDRQSTNAMVRLNQGARAKVDAAGDDAGTGEDSCRLMGCECYDKNATTRLTQR